MREILFKAKRIDNGEWVEGCYLLSGGKHFIYAEYIEHYCMPVIIKAEIIPETLCQFTGLCDKSGKKIWENDILKAWDDQYAQVKFGLYNPGSAISDFNQGFYVDFPEESFLRKELGYWHKKAYVRGNVFDNPELLQEESNE